MSTITVTTSNKPASLRPGVMDFMGESYNKTKLVSDLIFKKYKSKREFEVYAESRGQRLGSVKPQGGAISLDEQIQGITPQLRNYVLAKGFKISDETDWYGQYGSEMMKQTDSMMKALMETVEVVAADVPNRANVATQKMVNGDDETLLSTAHPTRGGTYANTPATPAPFSQSAIEDACIAIAKLKDPSGAVDANLIPVKLLLPTEQMFEATRILDSYLQSNNANNAINAIRKKFGGGVIEWTKLTNPNSWYIITDCPVGLIKQEVRTLEKRYERDEQTFSTFVAAAVALAFGWGDARSVYGSMPI